MSEQSTTTPSQRTVDATSLLHSLNFVIGVSKKTGKPYIMGTVFIKNGDSRPYGFDLAFFDNNGLNVVKDAIENLDNEQKANFAEGVKD